MLSRLILLKRSRGSSRTFSKVYKINVWSDFVVISDQTFLKYVSLGLSADYVAVAAGFVLEY